MRDDERQQIIERADRRCEYCQSHMDYSPATVETLNLNRLGLMNIRTVLLMVGLHPPG